MTPICPFLAPRTLNSILQNRRLMVKSENNQPTKTVLPVRTGNHAETRVAGGERQKRKCCPLSSVARESQAAEPTLEALV